MATTLEEVRKAYEDLSDDDKKKFHQSIADRVHESIAAQEEDSETKDSQSAEAREHEALGAEHADGKGDVEELHESDDTPEERREDERDEAEEAAKADSDDDWRKALDERLSRIEAMLKPSEESKTSDIAAADKMATAFGVGNGVFPSEAHEAETRKMTPEEVRKTITKIF